MRGKRTCLVCGKKYTYCPSCGKGKASETWRYLYDDKVCREIFNILANSEMSPSTAKPKLKNLMATKKITLKGDLKTRYDAIMAYEEPSVQKDEQKLTK